MCVVPGYTKDIALPYIIDFPTMEDRTQICRAHAFLGVSADTHHPLHKEIRKIKDSQLERGKSRKRQAMGIIQQVCLLEDKEPSAELVRGP